MQRRNQRISGSFVAIDVTCPDSTAVLEFDRLLEPQDDYSLVYDDVVDYFDIAVTGTLPPPSPTPTATPSPTPTRPPCAGDCNNDGVVRINELTTGINITLERAPISNCQALEDCMMDGVIRPVSCMTLAVRNALSGCPLE